MILRKKIYIHNYIYIDILFIVLLLSEKYATLRQRKIFRIKKTD